MGRWYGETESTITPEWVQAWLLLVCTFPPCLCTRNETQESRTQKAESFPLQPERGLGGEERNGGPWKKLEKEPGRPKVSERYKRVSPPQEFWQVVGSWRPHQVADHEASREKRGRGKQWPEFWCHHQHLPRGTEEPATGGSSVIMQVGTCWGGGCYFSGSVDKLLENLYKDLSARRSQELQISTPTFLYIHQYFNPCTIVE